MLAAPLLLWLLDAIRDDQSITAEVLSYQLLVVVVAVIGGIWPALFAAVLSALIIDLFFIDPHLTFAVADPVHLQALLLYVIIAVIISLVVTRAAKHSHAASEVQVLTTSNRVRSALLSALSHDLRRPLASATAAVGGLRAAGDVLSPADTRELLDTAEESLHALTTLVTDLLDVSRVQAGALSIAPSAVDPEDVLLPALEELGLAPGAVELQLAHGDAQLRADPVLLQRVIVNLLANAVRFSPVGSPVCVATGRVGDRIELRVADRGPGIPDGRKPDIFTPFQRLGDTDNTTGLGLGLALSRGFVEAMSGTLDAADTPGGGLTMVVSLPVDGGVA